MALNNNHWFTNSTWFNRVLPLYLRGCREKVKDKRSTCFTWCRLAWLQLYNRISSHRFVFLCKYHISRNTIVPQIHTSWLNNYMIVTDMEGNIRIYRLPKGRVTDQWKWYCLSRRREKYQFHGPYHDPRQYVYPDIALHICNYCIYCIEDQNLTHII